jgi:hypothetical protein
MTVAIHRWTVAWFGLSTVLAIQVLQEVMSGSYRAYGEALNLLHEIFPYAPVPRFQFEVWLLNVSGAALVLLALTWLVQKRYPIMRAASFALATFATGNAMGHILGLFPSDDTPMAAFMPMLLLSAALFLFLSVPGRERESARLSTAQ